MPPEKAPRPPAAFGDLPKANAKARLKDFTPRAYRCAVTISCPAALFDVEQRSYVIIGSTIQHENEPDICNRVDRHETAVKIDGQLINPAVLNAALKYASFTFLFILLLKLLVALPVRIVGMVALFVWILFKSLVLLPLQLTYSIISQIIVYPLKMAGIGGFNRSCS